MFKVGDKFICPKDPGSYGFITEMRALIGTIRTVKEIDQDSLFDGEWWWKDYWCVKVYSCIGKPASISTGPTTCQHVFVKKVLLGIGPAAEVINVCCSCKQEVPPRIEVPVTKTDKWIAF